MSQLTLKEPINKEGQHRPVTRQENTKKTPLTHSSSSLAHHRTQHVISVDSSQDIKQVKGLSTRMSLGENSNNEYLYIRLMRKNIVKTPNMLIARIQEKLKNQNEKGEMLFGRLQKMRGISMGRANNKTPKQEKEDTNRPSTCQNIGDKTNYFDQFLANPDILKQYKIMSHIGKGAFSVVSLAIEKESKKNFAIKTYQKIDALDWNRLACIKREVRNLKNLNNQKIVKLVGLVKQRKKLYLIMQNGGKQSLGGVLRKQKTMSEPSAKRYFKQILQGVAYIHQKGVCHRDLKPENILIDDNGAIKIIDFGFSTTSKIVLTNFCGTPAYMCPELVKKIAYNGAKADVWALGIILYLMLVGNFPFRASNEPELYRLILNGKYRYREQGLISEAGKRLISRMLQVKPQDRPSTSQLLMDNWLN